MPYSGPCRRKKRLSLDSLQGRRAGDPQLLEGGVNWTRVFVVLGVMSVFLVCVLAYCA